MVTVGQERIANADFGDQSRLMAVSFYFDEAVGTLCFASIVPVHQAISMENVGLVT